MSAAPDPAFDEEAPRLIDLLLEEQQNLSAVERFSQKHVDAKRPAQERYYRELIPANLPGPDQQYAFRVDLDACTGCKACVTACHAMNGLDEDETWRDVGLVVGRDEAQGYLQTVTGACHHCEQPGCLEGCPVRAYEKDPVTGIVRHLDDQCIGCQYCVLKCPYEVPKYNPRQGIVRKCDMCHGRLAEGEAPACVQGCPNEAIQVRIVAHGERTGSLLPLTADGMPSSSITRPTTRYVTRKPRPQELVAADHDRVRPADPHTPLAIMLVASQLSFGLLVADRLLAAIPGAGAVSIHALAALVAAVVAGAGQAAAMLHLGRPQYAFRAFLGWRTSWMSREILAFGAYAGAVVAFTASQWATPIAAALSFELALQDALVHALGVGALITGLLGTVCSVMIYADTQREFWSFGRTGPRFFGTAAVLGPAALWLCASFAPVLAPALSFPEAGGSGPLALLLALATAVATSAKLAGETRSLRALGDTSFTTLKRSANLIVGPLRRVWLSRIALGAVGGLLLPAAAMSLAFATGEAVLAAWVALPALLCLVAGEFLERHLFFRAVASRAMPGTP